MKTRCNISGFTLIELMIVVAVIGTLAAIAGPLYQQHLIEARRAEAAGDMLELSQFMERFFTENGRYDQNTGGTAVSLPFSASPRTGTPTWYNLTVATTQTTFTVTATPKGVQLSSDTSCGKVNISETGKTCILNGSKCSDSSITATAAAVADCW